ncbi:FAD-dependent oxidoreductase [Tenggerimyces flavus]|uniref:FAD-dependent oxidoreductase n=1 Tax=Tenggerimyces flavus TaxID=1708749 RepID=A0ABV7YL85_9ACTN|nr:FAD-dependent oxidoreductase [Tenggerimyces flavus]MBM7789573.1 protoporphyrinogen oxidase [Tenggerimyces flavus]
MARRVVVIGAGPAGLAAADVLASAGYVTTVIEAGDRPGGLSATERVGDFAFDYGGHRLISRNQRIVDFAEDLIGDDLIRGTRVSRLLFKGRFWSQPLEMADAMRGLTPGMAARAFLGYLAAGRYRLRNGNHQQASFEDWVVARFGRPLYSMFFGPYTAKVWGVDPSRIAAAWAPRRIMVGGLASLIKSVLVSDQHRPGTTVRRFLYPRLGVGQLYEALEQRCIAAGTEFRYGLVADSVELRTDEVVVGTKPACDSSAPAEPMEVAADAVISTAPLPNLVHALRPAPPAEVLSAAGQLHYRGIVFVFVLLDRSVALGWDALYVPEPDYLFFRVEEPSLWSSALVPEGKTSLCFEIAASPGDRTWEADDEELVDRCLEDFARIGFVISVREVIAAKVARQPHVYPMQLVETEVQRIRCLNWIDELSPRVQSVGRQGAFAYLDMDNSIERGWAAAKVVQGEASASDGALDGEFVSDVQYLWDSRRDLAGLNND